jgi:hypothetical protein
MKDLALNTGACKQEKSIGKKELNFEPMLDYKYSSIASGATPIGSAEHAPDRG